VRLCFRHSPEKHAHRFPGCLILHYDKAVSSVAFRNRQQNDTPAWLLLPESLKRTALSTVLGLSRTNAWRIKDTIDRKYWRYGMGQ
jgi:hypothetical protein